MAKIINITDKLVQERPIIQVGEDQFEVNNSMATVLAFEETANDESSSAMIEAVKIALGEDAVIKLDILNMSMESYKALIIAIMASVQNLSYEEASARFQF